ncbi:MAG TPA: hypothetical protein VJL83_01700 [Patescibacteria group bacterium]|nr:hypothetical protein [Patescibacteria group bacterium]
MNQPECQTKKLYATPSRCTSGLRLAYQLNFKSRGVYMAEKTRYNETVIRLLALSAQAGNKAGISRDYETAKGIRFS